MPGCGAFRHASFVLFTLSSFELECFTKTFKNSYEKVKNSRMMANHKGKRKRSNFPCWDG
ncbi:hypothetical protein HMPREF0322_03561 [Desulfitobacterium hafniense DP7]|uniref:Uncharacterized protein n=1 Tax=Desulfitobacterium hafniense DP7 TaxID=537010 RepID=G9XRG3_DESHA|nr:hypothetical protein HMPREF0322_03561 [Desulfitobacterium hafniense DP7]